MIVWYKEEKRTRLENVYYIPFVYATVSARPIQSYNYCVEETSYGNGGGGGGSDGYY